MSRKRKCERIHAHRRASDRFGMNLSQRGMDEIVKLIQGGQSDTVVSLWRTSNTRTTWAVFYEGQWLPVCYNKVSKQIVTVLPREALDEFADKLKGYQPCGTAVSSA